MGRDFLPFPTGESLVPILPSGTRQQRARNSWVAEGVATLNSLAGSRGVVVKESSTNQEVAIRRLAAKYYSLPPDPGVGSPRSCFRDMVSSKTGYADAGAPCVSGAEP